MKKNINKIVVSGGFDPVHVGHLQMLEKAKSLGNHLTVILNSDRFLKEKKGYIFMPYKERKKILLGFKAVDKVVNLSSSIICSIKGIGSPPPTIE